MCRGIPNLTATMRTFIILRLAFVCCILTLPLVHAARAQEALESFDRKLNIDVVDQATEARAGLFPDVSNFEEARLLIQRDSSYILEILYKENGKFERKRTSLTAQDVLKLRAKLEERLATMPTQLNQSGRSSFLTTTTTAAVAFYGWAIPTALGMSSSQAYVASDLFIGGAGFLIPWLATEHAEVTRGMSSLARHGALAGAAHGLILTYLIDNNASYQTVIGTTAIGSIAELGAGYEIAHATHLSEGSANIIEDLGTYGYLFGLEGLFLATDSPNENTTLASLLAGTAVGYAAGVYLANDQHYTVGNASVVSNTIGLGTLLPVAAWLVILDPARFEIPSGYRVPFAASAMAGTIFGTYIGHNWIKDLRLSEAQGNYLALATLGGTLFGAGAAYLVDPRPNSVTPYVLLITAGAVGGFGIMFDYCRNHPEHFEETMKLDLNVTPSGLLGALNSNFASRDGRVPPFLTASLKF